MKTKKSCLLIGVLSFWLSSLLPAHALAETIGTLTPERETKAREILRQVIAELDGRAKPFLILTIGQANPNAPKTREQQLTELTELYKADVISSRVYHERRAKLVASP